MQKIEPVSEFIFRQEKYQNELFYLRKLIFNQFPSAEEAIKWKIPFYNYQKRPLVYLSPTKEHLIIGFMDGIHLEDEDNLFAQKSLSLKRIRHVYFPEPLNQEQIEHLTDEEIEIQNQKNEEFEKCLVKMLRKAAHFIETKKVLKKQSL